MGSRSASKYFSFGTSYVDMPIMPMRWGLYPVGGSRFREARSVESFFVTSYTADPVLQVDFSVASSFWV